MRIDLQQQIKSNPYYLMFLRENPIWYKYLNRDPKTFGHFEQLAKKEYKLTAADKTKNIVDQISFITEILDLIE